VNGIKDESICVLLSDIYGENSVHKSNISVGHTCRSIRTDSAMEVGSLAYLRVNPGPPVKFLNLAP
jgi:hypothetical protein